MNRGKIHSKIRTPSLEDQGSGRTAPGYKLPARLGVLIAICFIISPAFSQVNQFAAIQVSKELGTFKKYDVSAAARWKHFFSENGWSRMQVRGDISRDFNNWRILGGLVTQFTYDESISDYFELRPWLGLRLSSPVISRLNFQQTIKFEWRNLMFTDGSPGKTTTRARYKLGLQYDFPRDWGAKMGYEWYFLPNKDLGTRFISSNELSFGAFVTFSHKYKLDFTYFFERFDKNNNPDAVNGSTWFLTFTFKNNGSRSNTHTETND